MAVPVAAVAGFLVLRKIIKLVIKIILFLVFAAAIYFVVTLSKCGSQAGSRTRQPSQAIVMMGSAQYNGVPSPDLLGRLAGR